MVTEEFKRQYGDGDEDYDEIPTNRDDFYRVEQFKKEEELDDNSALV